MLKVSRLFANVLVNFRTNLIVNHLFPDSSSRIHGMNKQQLRKFFNWTCNHTTFPFKGKFYKQLDSMAMRTLLTPAMGTLLTPAMAGVFMN